MNQIFQDNSPLVIGVKKVLDIVLLDVLWLLTSIPVVTIGMSTTAFYDVAYRDIWHGRGMVALDYFASCKRNFRQSMAAGVLYAAMTAVLVVDVSLLRAMADQGAGWGGFWVPVAVFAGLLAVYFVWVAANIARFQAPLKTILKNALALGLAHLPVSLLVGVLIGAAGLCIWLLPGALFVLPTLCMLGCCVLIDGVFRKYMPPEELERERTRNGRPGPWDEG